MQQPATLATIVCRFPRGKMMKRFPGLLLVVLLTVAGSAQWTAPAPADIPAYHSAAPAKAAQLPAILNGMRLSGPNFQHGYQVKAYQLAARIPGVIYQQPCFCHCDRSVGHQSLRSCFESEHGAHCSTCMAEVYYAYQMTKAGKTPRQIRAGILRGEFQSIDLEKAAR